MVHPPHTGVRIHDNVHPHRRPLTLLPHGRHASTLAKSSSIFRRGRPHLRGCVRHLGKNTQRRSTKQEQPLHGLVVSHSIAASRQHGRSGSHTQVRYDANPDLFGIFNTLSFATTLLGIAPYMKWSHAFYRPFAAYFKRIRG